MYICAAQSTNGNTTITSHQINVHTYLYEHMCERKLHTDLG